MALLFGDMTLGCVRRELRSGSTVRPIEPQVFDLLEFLIANRERVVSRDDLLAGVWKGRIVSDSAIDARINAARRAIGDDGEQQRWIRTIARKGFRFIGDVREEARPAARSPADAASQQGARPAARAQEITFCRTKDGVKLALASTGQGAPLVRTATWFNHLEYDWHSPLRSALLHFLADRFQLIRYDARGNGLSDRYVPEISFATFQQDLEAVLDSLNLRRCALLGLSQGAATAIAHAVRHPDRVSRMVLNGGFALGRNRRGAAKDLEMGQAYLTLTQQVPCLRGERRDLASGARTTMRNVRVGSRPTLQ